MIQGKTDGPQRSTKCSIQEAGSTAGQSPPQLDRGGYQGQPVVAATAMVAMFLRLLWFPCGILFSHAIFWFCAASFPLKEDVAGCI